MISLLNLIGTLKKLEPGKIFLEALMIIFSVLIALYFNNLRESARDREITEKALNAIRSEVIKNKEFVAPRVGYYSAMADTIANLISIHGKDAKGVKIPGWRGAMPLLLRDAAFKTTISTQNFAGIPFEIAERISFHYSFQEIFGKMFEKFLYDLIDDNAPSLRKLYFMFSELKQMGGEMVESYQTIEVILKNQTVID